MRATGWATPAPGASGGGASGLGRQAARYASVYAALWKNSVAREMTFKANFLLWILVESLWFGLQVSFIGVLYLHTDSIGTWTKWQVVLLVGASHFIQQLFQSFFLINCTNLSEAWCAPGDWIFCCCCRLIRVSSYRCGRWTWALTSTRCRGSG